MLIRDYVVHADTTLLAVAGYAIKKRFTNLTPKILKLMIPRASILSSGLFDRCNAALKYEVIRARDEAQARGELFNPRNFFLRTDAFRNAKNKIDADMDLLTPAEFYQRCGFGALQPEEPSQSSV